MPLLLDDGCRLSIKQLQACLFKLQVQRRDIVFPDFLPARQLLIERVLDIGERCQLRLVGAASALSTASNNVVSPLFRRARLLPCGVLRNVLPSSLTFQFVQLLVQAGNRVSNRTGGSAAP